MTRIIKKVCIRSVLFFLIVTVPAFFFLSSQSYHSYQAKKDLITAHWVQYLYELVHEDSLDLNLLSTLNPELFMQQINQPVGIVVTDIHNVPLYSFSSIQDDNPRDIRSFPIINSKESIAVLTVSFPEYKLNTTVLYSALLFSILPGCCYAFLLWYTSNKHQQTLLEIYHQLLEADITKEDELRNLKVDRNQVQEIKARIGKLNVLIDNLRNIRKNMVADFAHELRTPISIMRVKLEGRIEHQEILSTEEMYLLMDELYRMTKMITDLQNLSLAEAGNLSLNKHWFSLNELISHVVELLDAYAVEVKIAISVHMQQDLLIYADRDCMKQIFMNLIYNALQHSNSIIRIEGKREGAILFLKLEDDGNGIDEEEIPYVFERFYRSRDSKNTKGMGLGLAIARSLVSAHAGTIAVQSVWGKGTVFLIKLPVFLE